MNACSHDQRGAARPIGHEEGRPPDPRKEKADDKIIAAAAFVVTPWRPAHAQAIVGSIPEEFRGDWCQENTKDNVFKPGGCKLKAGSLSIDRLTLDTGRLRTWQPTISRWQASSACTKFGATPLALLRWLACVASLSLSSPQSR